MGNKNLLEKATNSRMTDMQSPFVYWKTPCKKR